MTNILTQDIANARPLLPDSHYAAIQKAALDYAELNRLKLFAIDPKTRQGSFYSGHSDRARWEAAFAAGMHLGVSAINSDCLLFDVDVHGPEDRDEAWQHYLALCKELKIAVLPPYAHSKSGGWHFAFRAPSWFKDGLRKGHHKFKISHFRPLKPGEVDKERISVRWRALNVYAGSVSNGGVHQLAVDEPPPHPYGPATANLFEWYATLKVGQGSVTTAPSTDACLQSDGECVKLERFVRELMLKDPAWFEDRDHRRETIWALKRSGFGYRGYETAKIICDVTPDGKGDRLNRYWNDSGANTGTKTLASFWKKCADLGIRQAPQEIAEWRKAESEKTMVDLNGAAAALAKPISAMPMLSGQQAIVDEGTEIVAGFILAHTHVAHTIDAPQLPLEIGAMPLRGRLTEAVGKLVTLADWKREALKFDDVSDVLGVLAVAHPTTFALVVERMQRNGAVLPAGKLKRAEDAFAAIVQRSMRTVQGWHRNHKGEPDPRISENVDVLLNLMGAEVRFDKFCRRYEYKTENDEWRHLDDDEHRFIHYTAGSIDYGFHVSEGKLKSSVHVIGRRRTIDGLQDLVDGLVWDGVARLDSWLHEAVGTPPDQYHRAVGLNIIGGMVRRARRPGCRHDECAIFISPTQGTGKSTLPSILALNDGFFLESYRFGESDQNALPKLAGKWVCELSELAGMKKAETEDVKAFLSTKKDNYTAKYDAVAKDHPRRCVFIGTSNTTEPLSDPSGGRRFLPIHVRELKETWLREHVKQLVAEAAVREAKGETFGIPRDLWDVAAEHQEAARHRSAVEDWLSGWFGNWADQNCYISATDLQIALREAGIASNVNVSVPFRKVGFQRKQRGKQSDRVWCSNNYTQAGAYQLRLTVSPNRSVTWASPLGAEIFSPAQIRDMGIREQASACL